MTKQQLTLLVCLLSMFLSYFSCRKIDDMTDKQQTHPFSKDLFFNSHRSKDPIEKVIVEYLKRQDAIHPFAKVASERIGYPRWDKIIAHKLSQNTNTLVIADSGNASNTTTFYIPFVREAENHVNAAMVVQVAATDTSFHYLCDWQYSNKVHGDLAVDTSAERYALFFMLLDQQTLGHQSFHLTDPALFPKSPPQNNKDRLLQILRAEGGSSLMEYHEVCVDFYVCGAPDYCAEHGGCDYLHCASPEGMPSHCYLVQRYCNGFWEDNDGGGGGSTGPGTGGGDGGGGGDTPPQCPGSNAQRRPDGTPDPCGPGWEPIDDDDGGGNSQFPRNPCQVVDSLMKTTKFKDNLKELRDSTILNYEKGKAINNPFDSLNYSEQNYAGTPPDSLAVDVILTQSTDGVMHNHYNDPLRLHNFSAEDIYKLAFYWSMQKIKNLQTFTYTVVTDSTAYILMVSDPAKFVSFAQTWFDSENHIKAFMRHLYNNYEYAHEGNSIQQDEINFLSALQAPSINGGGLKVFKGNADLTSFSPIKVNSNGQVRPDPCN